MLRGEARKLVSCIVKLLANRNYQTRHNDGAIILKQVPNILLDPYDNSLLYERNKVWLPFFQRWRLRRACRRYLIRQCYNNLIEVQPNNEQSKSTAKKFRTKSRK